MVQWNEFFTGNTVTNAWFLIEETWRFFFKKTKKHAKYSTRCKYFTFVLEDL